MHKEPEGKYTVTVPALPGCVTFGNNVDHVIEMAKEAIEVYIQELQARGEDITLNLRDNYSFFLPRFSMSSISLGLPEALFALMRSL